MFTVEGKKKRVVTLEQDSDDVDIFVDGVRVAFFNGKGNCLYRFILDEDEAKSINIELDGECIKVV